MLRGLKYIALPVLAVLLLTACGKEKKQEKYEPLPMVETFKGMCNGQAIINYDKVVQTPNISVNLISYDVFGDKKAIFKTEGLMRHFYIKDANTDETVYRGIIEEPVYNVVLDAYISTGDFTDFTNEGNYIVYADYVGESYPFEIKGKVTASLFKDKLKAFFAKMSTYTEAPYVKNSFTQKAEALNYLLLSYSLYPKVYTDGQLADSVNEIPDILDEIKKVIEWYRTLKAEETGTNDRMAFIGLLAKFSQVYKDYDNIYATTCRKEAEELYKSAVKSGEDAADVQVSYYANSVLYHLTGYIKYRSALYEIMDNEKFTHENWDYAFLAEMNYLTGKKSVDIERCNVIMKNIMSYTEEITETSAKDELGIVSYKTGSILRKMRYMVIANYVLESNEYREMLHNHYTYLAGVNVAGTNNLNTLQDNEEVWFLFMLADMNGNV